MVIYFIIDLIRPVEQNWQRNYIVFILKSIKIQLNPYFLFHKRLRPRLRLLAVAFVTVVQLKDPFDRCFYEFLLL